MCTLLSGRNTSLLSFYFFFCSNQQIFGVRIVGLGLGPQNHSEGRCDMSFGFMPKYYGLYYVFLNTKHFQKSDVFHVCNPNGLV